MSKILFSQRPEEYKNLLVTEMKKIELFFKHEFDIWTSYKLSNYKFYLAPINFFIKTYYILPLKHLKFRNKYFNSPNQPNELMDVLYKNWQTPISNDFRKFEMK